jgi:hypothetical protein
VLQLLRYCITFCLESITHVPVLVILADKETIPQSVLQLDGALAQLTGHQKSDFASEIFQIVAGYQSHASDNCLGLPRTQNASLQKTTNSRFKKAAPGISKGKMLLAEMKMKKEEAGRVKITAGLYIVSKNKGGTGIMKKVSLLDPTRCAISNSSCLTLRCQKFIFL